MALSIRATRNTLWEVQLAMWVWETSAVLATWTVWSSNYSWCLTSVLVSWVHSSQGRSSRPSALNSSYESYSTLLQTCKSLSKSFTLHQASQRRSNSMECPSMWESSKTRTSFITCFATILRTVHLKSPKFSNRQWVASFATRSNHWRKNTHTSAKAMNFSLPWVWTLRTSADCKMLWTFTCDQTS